MKNRVSNEVKFSRYEYSGTFLNWLKIWNPKAGCFVCYLFFTRKIAEKSILITKVEQSNRLSNKPQTLFINNSVYYYVKQKMLKL